MAEAPTIYEWAGGTAAFERWLNTFYDLVEADDELVALFGGRVSEEHREHVLAWWVEVMGGPTPTRVSSAATRRCSPTTGAWASRPSNGCASSPC